MTVVVDADGDERLIVLCDDGTMWSYVFAEGAHAWWQLPLIPPDTPEQQQEPERQPE